ncbi:MAG: efflux RND transporter periplasmic adaptor subunit [Thermoguttaceae bacterium]
MTHRFFIFAVSIAFTGAMLGGVICGSIVFRSYSTSFSDAEFLQNRLNAVLQNGNNQKSKGRSHSLVRVEPVCREVIETIRPFYGRLFEVQLAKISSEVSGVLEQLPIEIGQKVKGGETLIAQIDKTWIQLELSQIEQEISILEAQSAHQSAEATRLESLAVSHAVTESEINNQKTLANQYQHSLEKTKIAHIEATEKLKRTTILAPFDGYIVKREVGLRDLLAPGTPIAEIVSLGAIDAIVNIGEFTIDRLKIGDSMTIVIDSLNEKVTGTVHAIVPYGPTGGRFFPVVVRLDDQGGKLKVGMSVTALVATTDSTEELVVSKDAVLDKPDGTWVWIASELERNGEKGYEAKPIPVRIVAKGITQYGIVPETEEGKQLLVQGTQVIIEGAERLVPNQQIRITEMSDAISENLPPVSGQKEIAPKERITQKESESAKE